MAIEKQADEMFAGDRHVMRWNGILDEDGVAILDLTGRIVKFALSGKDKNGVPLPSPILDFETTDASPQVVIINPVLGLPHVEVELLPANTVDLAPKDTTYHAQLRVFENDGSTPIVVATINLKIKPALVNVP